MVTDLVFAHVLPLPLAGWAVAVGVGIWFTISGIRPALEEGDTGSSWLISLAAIGSGAAALSFGWHLPAGWGAFWSLGSEGLYVASIAAGAVNVGLSLAARGYEAGYIAGALGSGFGFADVRSPDLDRQWQEVINRQSIVIAALTADRDRLVDDLTRFGPPARDLQEVLRYDGVRRAVLKILHPDAHAAAGDRERRVLTERFQKASAVFEKLGSE
jgi:hypothetical protein